MPDVQPMTSNGPYSNGRIQTDKGIFEENREAKEISNLVLKSIQTVVCNRAKYLKNKKSASKPFSYMNGMADVASKKNMKKAVRKSLDNLFGKSVTREKFRPLEKCFVSCKYGSVALLNTCRAQEWQHVWHFGTVGSDSCRRGCQRLIQGVGRTVISDWNQIIHLLAELGVAEVVRLRKHRTLTSSATPISSFHEALL